MVDMKLALALTPSRTVFAPLLYAGNLPLGIRRAAELGYHGIELNLRDAQAEDLDAIESAATAHGLKIVALGTGQCYLHDGLSVAAADPAIRARLVERLKHHVDFAARVGAQVVLGGVRGRFEADPKVREAQYRGAVDVVRQLADYAASRGVTITLEPINRYESNFINTADEAMSFLDDVDRPTVQVLLDTFHMNIEETAMGATFERVGKRLSHVHLVDSNRRAPGMGHIDFAPILDALRRIGYNGYLSGEFLPLPDDDTAARENRAYVGKLLGLG